MSRRIALALSTVAVAASVGLVAPATASAAPVVTPTPVGSVALCFGIPLGFFTFSVCI